MQTLLDLKSLGLGGPNLSSEIGTTQERLARSKVSVGDLDGALNSFRELLKNSEPCDEQGAPTAACRTLGVRLSWTGDVYAASEVPNLGEPDKAIPFYEQAIHIEERFAAMDDHDRQARFNMAARYGKLGDAVSKADPKRALDLYERALATAKTLASKEQLEILEDSYRIAIVPPLIQLGRIAEARKVLIGVLEQAKTDSNSPYADRISELDVRVFLPDLLVAESKPDEARQAFKDLIRDIETLRSSHKEDLELINQLSRSYRSLAALSKGQERRDALLSSAAAWHSWPATSFTMREEQKDLTAANN
jgi:tetratricopeptide (TPR) repeat protein